MKRTINAVKARQTLGELLDAVYHRDDRIIIERDGKPMAALVPMFVIEREDRAKGELKRIFEEAWARNKEIDAAEAERIVAEAVAEVRGNRPPGSLPDAV